MKKVKGVLIDVKSKEPKASVVEIEDSLDEFYRILDCSTIDVTSRKLVHPEKWFDIVCDDEGAIIDNLILSAFDLATFSGLFGNLSLCLHDGKGEFVSLSDEDIKDIMNWIADCDGSPLLTLFTN